MKRRTIRAISIFLFLILISPFFTFSTGYASTPSERDSDNTSNRKIRVAQIDLSKFYDNDLFRPTGGYGFEYLMEISNYTGWEYEYVPVSWNHGLEMLKAGNIDLMAPVPMTPELKREFAFSNEAIGLNYSILCVSAENTETAYNDFEAINGMKVGLLQGASINSSLESFTDANNIWLDTVMFENQNALLVSLNEGKIDAILTSSLEKRPAERTIARFAPTPFYFITAKGNMELMEPLNAALFEIKEANPYFNFELQSKYYSWNEYSVPVFTMEEKEYIKNAGALRTVYDPAWAPIEYYDEAADKFSGINADIFNLISDVSGLKFSFVQTGSYTEALNLISNRKADILTGIGNDVNWASKHNIKLTDPYLSASIVLVKNKKVNNLEDATIALAKDYLAATEYVKKSSPGAKIKYYDTPAQCFKAVNYGAADITYANSYVAEKLLENPKLNRLSIVETVNLTDNLSIGVSDSADPILLSILNKSIHSITDVQLNAFIFEHTINEKPEINLEYMIYRNPSYLLLGFLVLFIITTIVMTSIIVIKNYHNEKIEKVAYLDSVTGTLNYNRFKVDAHELLKNAKNRKYAIVYIDIYRFSYINDTFGYYAGDIILSEVAKELIKELKDCECSARLSADNFVCLLEYESDEILMQRNKTFQQQCDERLAQINSRFKVQFTSAIYKINPGENDIPSLVGKADIAFKTLGDIHKTTFVFYNDKIQNEYLKKKKLESSMSSSLENGDFLVYLQPKFSLSTSQITGTEALARWLHPTDGLIMPQQFIALFESNGFILELDFYIYEKVCQTLRKWMDAGEKVLPVSVNVSKAHLADRQFGSQLKDLIERYRIPPNMLELELTESILFDDSQEAVTMIRSLKDLGFSILIDDFGSGYSSLNLLKDLTVDVLKLDKEFFRKGAMAEKDKIIVDGIIRIANDLNLKILSEGVETQEQVDFLTKSGCHTAQGYFFAKPMPIEDFEKLIGYKL